MATQQNSPSFQWNSSDGTPAVGFLLYTYLAGTMTPVTTYKDYLATDENTNPIELDAYGAAQIYISVSSKFILKDLDGVIVFTADNLTATTNDIIDPDGSYLIKFISVPDAIDDITVANAAENGSPTIGVDGLDVNIDLTLNAKGSDKIILGPSTSSGIQLSGNQPILDSTSNELLKFIRVASAVNDITIANASIGTNPTIYATGDDTNIGIDFRAKGTGSYGIRGTLTQRGHLDLYEQATNGSNKITFRTPAAITTDHALTFDGGGTDRTLTYGGNLTTVGAFTTGGAFTTTSTFSQTGSYSASAAVSFGDTVTTAGAFVQAGAFSTTITSTATTNSTLPAGTKTLVPNDLTLTAAGLVTGGGNLSTNRTFTVSAATQVQCIVGTDNTVAVTPLNQKYHNSAVSTWVVYNTVTTTSIINSYNVSSLTDNGAGNTTINFTTSYANTSYSPVGLSNTDVANAPMFTSRTNADIKTVSAFQIRTFTDSGTGTDSAFTSVHIVGTLA